MEQRREEEAGVSEDCEFLHVLKLGPIESKFDWLIGVTTRLCPPLPWFAFRISRHGLPSGLRLCRGKLAERNMGEMSLGAAQASPPMSFIRSAVSGPSSKFRVQMKADRFRIPDVTIVLRFRNDGEIVTVLRFRNRREAYRS